VLFKNSKLIKCFAFVQIPMRLKMKY